MDTIIIPYTIFILIAFSTIINLLRFISWLSLCSLHYTSQNARRFIGIEAIKWNCFWGKVNPIWLVWGWKRALWIRLHDKHFSYLTVSPWMSCIISCKVLANTKWNHLTTTKSILSKTSWEWKMVRFSPQSLSVSG